MIIYWSIKCSINNSIDQSINQFIIDQTMFNKSLNLSINHSITCWINQWVDSPINLSVNQLINYSFKWPNNQSVDQIHPSVFCWLYREGPDRREHPPTAGRIPGPGSRPERWAHSLYLYFLFICLTDFFVLFFHFLVLHLTLAGTECLIYWSIIVGRLRRWRGFSRHWKEAYYFCDLGSH